MKIIDLLNLIAKGEEVPKKIKYKNKIYFRTWGDYMGDEPIDEYYFDSEQNSWNAESWLKLDDEVEIIEEEKEIEKLYFSVYECERLEQTALDKIETKINELIDEINKLKRDKE